MCIHIYIYMLLWPLIGAKVLLCRIHESMSSGFTRSVDSSSYEPYSYSTSLRAGYARVMKNLQKTAIGFVQGFPTMAHMLAGVGRDPSRTT